jgi:predicted nucleotidyltransferase
MLGSWWGELFLSIYYQAIGMLSMQPCPGKSTFSDMYAERKDLLSAINRVIDHALPTRTEDGRVIVEFSNLERDGDRVLGAINESPRPAIAMFLAVTGYSTNDVETKLNFYNTYDIADTGSGLAHKDHRAKRLSRLLASKLNQDLLKETVVAQTTFRWTLDHRRHYRSDFEADVQDHLKNGGVPLLPDHEVEGSPDIAIPRNNDDFAVIGEIRSSNKQDWGARIAEFQSEVRDHAATHPGAKIVIVVEFAESVSPERYARMKTRLREQVGGQLDRLYTHEELDSLLMDCQLWTPQIQQPLHIY